MLVEGGRLMSRARLVRIRVEEMGRCRGVVCLRSGHVGHVRVDGLFEQRGVVLVALVRRRRKQGEVSVVEGRVEEGGLRRVVSLDLLVEALAGVESRRIGDVALAKGLREGVAGGVIRRREVVRRGGSGEWLRRGRVQANTKASRWLVRREGAWRWRVGLSYMGRLMPRRRRTSALALLVHDLRLVFAEIEARRGTFQVSLSGTVAEHGAVLTRADRTKSREGQNAERSDDESPIKARRGGGRWNLVHGRWRRLTADASTWVAVPGGGAVVW